MSFSRRLGKIEQQSQGETIDADKMLVELLAKRDALFWPWRCRGHHRGAVEQIKTEYQNGSRGLSARAAGKDSWKSTHAQRNDLIRRGLAIAVRSGGEVTGLRLTNQGEENARAMVGDRTCTLNHPVTRELYAKMESLISDTPPWMRGRWLSESQLFGKWLYGDPTDWEELTETVLPLLTAGVVIVNNDGPGRLYYSLVYRRKEDTPPNEVNNQQGDYQRPRNAPLPEVPQSNERRRGWADELYLSTFDAERPQLAELESRDLIIPIPASNWFPTDRYETLMAKAMPGQPTEF